MNLNRRSLLASFLVCFALTLATPVVFPSLRLFFFAPFLVMLYYQKSYAGALWNSLLCGLLVDLLSAPAPLGIHAVTYTLATALIYHQRWNLFADSASTLPIMTFLFSLISTLLLAGMLYILGKPIFLSFTWAITDLLLMPALDALFGFCFFVLPFFLFSSTEPSGRRS